MQLLRNAQRRAYNDMTAKPFFRTIRDTPWTGMKVAGAVAAVSLGGLCAYGAMQPASYAPSKTRQAIRAFSGPGFAQKVRARMAKTYAYVAGGLGITAVSSIALFSRGYAGMFMTNPIMASIGCFIGVVACMMGTMGTPQENVGLKHAFGLGFAGLMGLNLCPLAAVGGALLQQAAMITGVIVGSLSMVAMVAPDDQFLSWGPYLGCGLGVVIAASFGSMFFPGSAMLHNICLYGGLGLFGCYVCYDTQKMLYHAEMDEVYDPINQGIGLYMDTINIFVRVVQILMMSQRRK